MGTERRSPQDTVILLNEDGDPAIDRRRSTGLLFERFCDGESLIVGRPSAPTSTGVGR